MKQGRNHSRLDILADEIFQKELLYNTYVARFRIYSTNVSLFTLHICTFSHCHMYSIYQIEGNTEVLLHVCYGEHSMMSMQGNEQTPWKMQFE